MDEAIRTVSEKEPLEDFYAYLDPQTVSQAKEFEKIMLAEIEDYEATAGDCETLISTLIPTLYHHHPQRT